ncbi:hypothetical protein E2C01_091607 [Portunus trituberculatus]|uniref:Uncharacterized protein n=1 Tax=Portunus trituberculatus TaxID=210409 RepID=A0A5B7JED5_PORTR|nr:hypothetical protein [Portunus trituberculatus]
MKPQANLGTDTDSGRQVANPGSQINRQPQTTRRGGREGTGKTQEAGKEEAGREGGPEQKAHRT